MPRVLVGGRKCSVTWPEYYASVLPEGTPVKFTSKSLTGKVTVGSGIYKGSAYYDGVAAYVDIGGRIQYLFLSSEDRMKRIKRETDLPFLGEGI